jgi:hypothetical protein
MNDAPSTFRGDSGHHASGNEGEFEWNDAAELQCSSTEGVLSSFQTIRRGEMGELVRFVMTLPEADRPDYAIQKAGDRRFEWREIAALARRPDFPEG